MNECVGLTEIAVSHDSIFGLEPPRFQKSGVPVEFVSDSSVGFGQIFPGSNPASDVDEHSTQAANDSHNNAVGALAAGRVVAPTARRMIPIIVNCNLVFKPIDPVYR
jgi:hypothetical protein